MVEVIRRCRDSQFRQRERATARVWRAVGGREVVTLTSIT